MRSRFEPGRCRRSLPKIRSVKKRSKSLTFKRGIKTKESSSVLFPVEEMAATQTSHRDRALFHSLNAVKDVHQRKTIIEHLHPASLDRVRRQLRLLVEGRSKRYKLGKAEQENLRKALSQHKRKILKFIDGEGEPIVKTPVKQTGGWIISLIVSCLVPLITSLIVK